MDQELFVSSHPDRFGDAARLRVALSPIGSVGDASATMIAAVIFQTQMKSGTMNVTESATGGGVRYLEIDIHLSTGEAGAGVAEGGSALSTVICSFFL